MQRNRWIEGNKRQHCMPKNFIRFDKFEQATTAAAVTPEEEEKNNRNYKIALRAKVVDEALHHARRNTLFIHRQFSRSFSQSVSQ